MSIQPNPASQLFQVEKGLLFSKKPVSWIEVDPQSQILRRVWQKRVTLQVPLPMVRRLFVLELGVFTADNFGILHEGRTQFELYVDGYADFHQLGTDILTGAAHVEYSIKRGALCVGGKWVGERGREIAAACGATFDENILTLPPVLPVPQQPTELEERLLWTATHFSTSKNAKAAAARELGRVGSPHAMAKLHELAGNSEPIISEGAQWGLFRLTQRMQAQA